ARAVFPKREIPLMPALPGSRPPPRQFVQLFARVPPLLKQRVTRLAIKLRCFEADVVEQALETYLDLHDKGRVAERAPVDNGPSKSQCNMGPETIREQTAREALESSVLTLVAQLYLSQPLRIVRLLLKSELTPHHFSDPVVRDVFSQLLPGLLA